MGSQRVGHNWAPFTFRWSPTLLICLSWLLPSCLYLFSLKKKKIRLWDSQVSIWCSPLAFWFSTSCKRQAALTGENSQRGACAQWETVSVYMPSCFTHVWLFVTLWTLACWILCPWGFSRQEYWSNHALLQDIFLTEGLNPTYLTSPTLASRFFTTRATWEAQQF